MLVDISLTPGHMRTIYGMETKPETVPLLAAGNEETWAEINREEADQANAAGQMVARPVQARHRLRNYS